jgi:hypothetical protein
VTAGARQLAPKDAAEGQGELPHTGSWSAYFHFTPYGLTALEE